MEPRQRQRAIMLQRPTVRTDSAEQRGLSGESPPLDGKHPKQRNPTFEPLAIRLAGKAEDGSSEANLEQVLNLIAEQACLATSATASAIALRQQDEIICRATAGPNAPELGVSLNLSSGLTGACARSREVQYCEDTETDPRVNAEVCRRLHVRSVLIVPLVRDGELVGVFEVFSPLQQAFARHDLQNLQALANVVLDSISKPEDRLPAPAEEEDPPSPTSVAATPAAPKATVPLAPIPESISPESPQVPAAPLVAQKDEPHTVLEPQPPKPAAYVEKPKWPVDEVQLAQLGETAPSVATRRIEGHTVLAELPILSTPPAEPIPAEISVTEEPPAAAPDFLASFSGTAPSRDWSSVFLTVGVVALAIVLGWMLGRAGWERAMGGRMTRTRSASSVSTGSNPAAQTQPSIPAGDADPVLVAPQEGVHANPTAARRASAAPQTPAQPATQDAPPGGLVVYQNGKIIFQQNSTSAPEPSAAATETAAPSSPGAPVAISPQVASAHLLERVEPVYPEQARQQFIQGEVVLQAVVGTDGKVEKLTLLSGDSQLAAAASAAVELWSFRPYQLHGKAVPFSTRLTVNFRLH